MAINSALKFYWKHSHGVPTRVKLMTYGLYHRLSRGLSFLPRPQWVMKLKMDHWLIHASMFSGDLGILKEILEENVYHRVPGFEIRPGDVVFDIGAHIGLFSMQCAKSAGPQGKIYSFEPSDRSFNRLKANVEINNLQNTQIFNLALSDRSGTSEFWVPPFNSTSAGFQHLDKYKDSKKIQVKTDTLDNFVREQKIKKINFMKIDVQGAELLVLKGALDQGLKITDRIVVENDNLSPDIGALLSSNGFKKVATYGTIEYYSR